MPARPRARDSGGPLILASGSRTRREMMAAAGLRFEVVPADVDEPAIRERLVTADPGVSGAAIAAALAAAKAEEVSQRRSQSLVIGANQVLALGSRLFEKPRDLAVARENLMDLRGQAHELISAVALAHAGNVAWLGQDRARLTMREFSQAFLDDYLARAGTRVTESVGCYQLEGLGLQLFERIEGDYFTILGMPLLLLMAELRKRGVVVT